MIQIANLVKKFGERTAVDGISLTIEQGAIFGLLGPNGAGKTTMIRMLTMLTRPTAGMLSINGWQLPQDEQKIKQILGIVPQHFNLDADLTAQENLELHGRLQHIPRVKRRQRSLGFVAAMLINSHEDMGNFSTYVLLPMSFLCATFFSIDKLPAIVRWVLELLPLTHASHALRAIGSGGEPADLSWLVMLGYIVVLLATSIWTMEKVRK